MNKNTRKKPDEQRPASIQFGRWLLGGRCRSRCKREVQSKVVDYGDEEWWGRQKGNTKEIKDDVLLDMISLPFSPDAFVSVCLCACDVFGQGDRRPRKCVRAKSDREGVISRQGESTVK